MPLIVITSAYKTAGMRSVAAAFMHTYQPRYLDLSVSKLRAVQKVR